MIIFEGYIIDGEMARVVVEGIAKPRLKDNLVRAVAFKFGRLNFNGKV